MDEQQLTLLTNTQSARALTTVLHTSAESMCLKCDDFGDAY